jgi:hypothetical protein
LLDFYSEPPEEDYPLPHSAIPRKVVSYFFALGHTLVVGGVGAHCRAALQDPSLSSADIGGSFAFNALAVRNIYKIQRETRNVNRNFHSGRIRRPCSAREKDFGRVRAPATARKKD